MAFSHRKAPKRPEGRQAAVELQGPWRWQEATLLVLVLVQRLARLHRRGIRTESHRRPWRRCWRRAFWSFAVAPASW